MEISVILLNCNCLREVLSMLMVDVMTRDVITVKKDTPVLEAQKIMREHDFRRLPVVDDKGRPIGIVSARRLETLKPQGTAPLLWQVGYLLSRTTVGEVMRKKVVTVKPEDTVEYAVAKAQAAKVGTLIVIENGKIVGIATTNDFFYNIVNPTLGIGKSGSRIVIIGGGTGKLAEIILSAVNKMGVVAEIIWAIYSPTNLKNNLVLHLETEDASEVIKNLTDLGFEARPVNR